MDEMDIHTQKKINDADLSIIFSLIPKEERILFISERISNKKLAISIRILYFMSVLSFFLFGFFLMFDFFSFKWIGYSIEPMMFALVFFGIFQFLLGYLFGKKYLNIRRDFYIILTENMFFTLFFSIKYKSPVLRKYPLSKIQYFTIKNRLFQKSANLIRYNIAEEIQKSKFKRIKDVISIEKYLDSILFHFGQIKEQWLLKVRYDLPLKLDISKDEYDKIKRRLKHVYMYFGISNPIIIFIGVFLGIIVSDITLKIVALIFYIMIALLVFIPLGIIYLIVWYELNRCSSLGEQMIVKNDEIEYNGIKIPLSKKRIISASYISSRNTTQTPMKPKQSIYCIEINDDLTLDKRKFFGPIEDFQKYFKFISFHILDWKNKNGHLFSKEQLYENEIKR